MSFSDSLESSLDVIEAALRRRSGHRTVLGRAKYLDKQYSKLARSNPSVVYSRTFIKAADRGVTPADQVRSVVLHAVLNTVVSGSSSVGRKHHWVPRAFLSGFGSYLGETTRSSLSVASAEFVDGEWVVSRVYDSHFCHGVGGDGRKDYNDVFVESLFANVESLYGHTDEDGSKSVSAAMALALIQVLRVPRDGVFPSGKTDDVLPALIALMDDLDGLSARLVDTDGTVFTEGFPTRSYRRCNGSTIHYFPVADRQALVFSFDEDVDLLPADIGDVFDDLVVNNAMVRGGKLYGSEATIARLTA